MFVYSTYSFILNISKNSKKKTLDFHNFLLYSKFNNLTKRNGPQSIIKPIICRIFSHETNFSAFLHCPVKFLKFVFKKKLKTINVIFYSLKLIRLICTIFYQAHILLDNKININMAKKRELK